MCRALELQALCAAALGCYMDTGGWGCVLLLLSVLLSRGMDNVRSDMDEQGAALMGMHGYCTQELVNLLLTGECVRACMHACVVVCVSLHSHHDVHIQCVPSTCALTFASAGSAPAAAGHQ
jgi:hypothetical protein